MPKHQKKSDKGSKNTSASEQKPSKGLKYLGGLLFSKMAAGGAAQLRSNADEVNRLNVFPVPDGDTGDNMRMTIESGISAIENLDTDDLAEVMRVLSHGMLLGARGNSGVILSQFFAGASKGFDGVEKADPIALGKALDMGVKQAYSSVVTPTEGTILTVAREAVEYAVSRITKTSTIRSFFADLVKEMHDSLDRTPELLSALKEAGVVDSGGAGLYYIMDGFNKVLNGEDISDSPSVKITETSLSTLDLSAFGPDSEMVFGYCTELLLRLQSRKTDISSFDTEALKAFLSSVGDSVVAFKDDSIVKIHVHTKTPDAVLSHCLALGEFLTVKIENMSLQHSSRDEESASVKKEELPIENDTFEKEYGFVAVVNGDGLSTLFKELGCDVIVEGGQTHNPSTSDILSALEKVNARNIFILPNNSNIFMAAEQAAGLYTRSFVHVIKSRSIGDGFAALSCADLDTDDPLALMDSMSESMSAVVSAYVSPAIRDAVINSVRISRGDTLGVIGKDIVLSEPDRLSAAVSLATRLLSKEGAFMLTVFCGKDSTEDETSALIATLSERFPSSELFTYYGGQDIYPYIFSCE